MVAEKHRREPLPQAGSGSKAKKITMQEILQLILTVLAACGLMVLVGCVYQN
jgi:hypothetical protein